MLLEGEAGCGKTRLASAIAYELGLPFYRWDVRSTTKAKEGLYEYDAILRLHDVQAKQVDPNLGRDPSDPKQYRRFGALGKAFCLKEYPAVVLIDEIDKADIDFPNDLLAVLDEPWEFEVPETGETGKNKIKAAHKPIVIVTSNKEKGNLPTPFLRRCVYYYINFPGNSERLEEIVKAHYQSQLKEDPKSASPAASLIKAAAERFLKVRQEGGLVKYPGTSEFLDWLQALHSFNQKPYPAAKLKSSEPIPYRELLFKLRTDWQKYLSPS